MAAPGRVRVGEGSTLGTSTVNQTGGEFILINGNKLNDQSLYDCKDPAELTLSDDFTGSGDCNGIYKMSGGTLTYRDWVAPGETAPIGGFIRIGDNHGDGTFEVTGTDSYIQMNYLHIGGKPGQTESTRHADGHLVFNLEHDGVSVIGIATGVNVHTYASSISTLEVNLLEALDEATAGADEIILVDNQGANAVVGEFDYFNDGSGAEGAYVTLGNNVYRLTYIGGNGNDISLIFDHDANPPAAPTGLVASTGYAIVELDWNANSEADLAGYNVYRSETSGSGYGKLNTTLLSSPTYDDNSISLETTYYYVVTAVDIYSYESGHSNEVSSGSYGDFSGDGIVDISDLPDFLDLWLVEDCDEIADVDGDCLINFYEFSVFANNWCK